MRVLRMILQVCLGSMRRTAGGFWENDLRKQAGRRDGFQKRSRPVPMILYRCLGQLSDASFRLRSVTSLIRS